MIVPKSSLTGRWCKLANRDQIKLPGVRTEESFLRNLCLSLKSTVSPETASISATFVMICLTCDLSQICISSLPAEVCLEREKMLQPKQELASWTSTGVAYQVAFWAARVCFRLQALAECKRATPFLIDHFGAL